MSKVKVTWKAFGNKPEINRYISFVGFEKIEDVEIKYHGDLVFRVSKKVSA